MWQSKYEKTFTHVSKESIWSAWTDVNAWPSWDSETQLTQIDGPFTPGTKFVLQPRGGPKVNIQLTEVVPLKSFTDVTSFPLAKMYDTHAMEDTPEGVKIISIIKIEGPLSWVWRKIVGEGVAKGSAKQIESLVKYVTKNKNV